MIDPLMAFAALKTASSTISSAVKAGKDLASLVGPITRLAKAEADLSFAAEKKGGILGKLTGAEQTAIDAHFRKEEAIVSVMRCENYLCCLVLRDSGRDYKLR